MQLKYDARIVPLDTEHNPVVVPAQNNVAAVLDVFEKALQAGKFNNSSSALVQRKTNMAKVRHKRVMLCICNAPSFCKYYSYQICYNKNYCNTHSTPHRSFKVTPKHDA